MKIKKNEWTIEELEEAVTAAEAEEDDMIPCKTRLEYFFREGLTVDALQETLNRLSAEGWEIQYEAEQEEKADPGEAIIPGQLPVRTFFVEASRSVCACKPNRK